MILAEIKKFSPYSEEQDAVIAQVEALISGGLSLARLQVETGIAKTHLQQLFARQPVAIERSRSERTAEQSVFALKAFLDRHKRDTAATSFAPTPTFNTIYNILGAAHAEGLFIAIAGSFGVSKSTAGKEYVRKHPKVFGKPGAVYIEFNPMDESASAMSDRIRGVLIEHQPGVYPKNIVDAVAAVAQEGDLLVCDESNHLGKKALDTIRAIHDTSKAGVALLGNTDFNGVWNDKKDAFGALVNRVSRYRFDKTTEEDVDVFLAYKGLTGCGVLRKVALRIASRPGSQGGLRMLDRLLTQLQRTGNPIDGGTLAAAAKLFGIAVSSS